MLTFTNAKVFDGNHNGLKTGLNISIEHGRIVDVSERPPKDQAEVIDCGGSTLMPGLIDAHIHAYASDVNVQRISEAPATLFSHFAGDMLRKMLGRGFTSVRDTGGADYGLYIALQRGWTQGPRLFYCGKALSQTGGHGDFRHQHHAESDCEFHACACNHVSPLSAVADGVDQVRQAVRENFRRGASFIKFMGSGGVSTTGDALGNAQYSDEEIRAIIDECERHDAYCTAHIHPDAALKRAVNLGVHCIEHGTLIEPDTASLAAERGTYIVPTLAIIISLAEEGAELGYPPESLAKLSLIRNEAVQRLGHMKKAGVRIGFGTDLLGKLERHQCSEFAIRSEVFSSFEILHQATATNGEILGYKGELGVIAQGAFADLLIVDGNPLLDINVLAKDGATISLIMKDGVIVKDRLRRRDVAGSAHATES